MCPPVHQHPDLTEGCRFAEQAPSDEVPALSWFSVEERCGQGASVAVAAHFDVARVDEGGGVAVVVPDRPAGPEGQIAGLGRSATGVDPHDGALLERRAGQGKPLAAVPASSFQPARLMATLAVLQTSAYSPLRLRRSSLAALAWLPVIAAR
jgi:hypothetical protein